MLAVDVMFVNKIPFLVSVSHNLKFVTVQRLKGRAAHLLVAGLNKIVKIYKQRGFNVNTAVMDGEFEPLKV